MRPFDPRLLTRIGPARKSFALLVGTNITSAILLLAQALILARLLAPVLSPVPPTSDGLGALGSLIPESLRQPRVGLVVLGGIVVVRSLVVWASERIAHRAGAQAISALRTQVVTHVGSLGPRWLASGKAPETAVLVTKGLDDLLPYFTQYLPALLTAATVTPLVVIVVLGLDLTSALIVFVTIPLVPLFMVLIGRLTQTHAKRHLAAMMRLGSQTLDLIVGLPTLKALGRSRGPVTRIRELGDAHRRAAMSSLRVAFLSGMVLELLTTLSVALIAVSMGFRLAAGDVGLETALAVLILAPEAYMPLRNIGSHFHASSKGVAAADAAFSLLGVTTPIIGGTEPAPSLQTAALRLDAVSVSTPEGALLAPSDLDLVAHPGEVTVLVGPNGEGKSTALLVLAGLVPPTTGTVSARVEGASRLPDSSWEPRTRWVTLADTAGGGVDPSEWSTQCAWVPQRPDLGVEGATLSLGQRERTAVTRACGAGRPVVLLDEPTAHLDGEARLEVIKEIRRVAERGAVVVVATHDEALIAAADSVVEVRATAVRATASVPPGVVR